jgi:hypothetical protein
VIQKSILGKKVAMLFILKLMTNYDINLIIQYVIFHSNLDECSLTKFIRKYHYKQR